MSNFEERARRAASGVWDKTAAVTPRETVPVSRRPKVALAAVAIAVVIAGVVAVIANGSSSDDESVALAEVTVRAPTGFREVSATETNAPPQSLDPATTAAMRSNHLVKAYARLSERPEGVTLAMTLQFPDHESAVGFIEDYAAFFTAALPRVSGSKLAVDEIPGAHGFQGVIVLASPQNPTPITGGSGIFFARGSLVFSLSVSTLQRTDTADLARDMARRQAEQAKR